jgi:hypothetical protein
LGATSCVLRLDRQPIRGATISLHAERHMILWPHASYKDIWALGWIFCMQSQPRCEVGRGNEGKELYEAPIQSPLRFNA